MSNKVIIVKCFVKFVLIQFKRWKQSNIRGKVSITNEISFELRMEIILILERFSNDCRKNQNQSNHFDQSQQKQTAP